MTLKGYLRSLVPPDHSHCQSHNRCLRTSNRRTIPQFHQSQLVTMTREKIWALFRWAFIFARCYGQRYLIILARAQRRPPRVACWQMLPYVMWPFHSSFPKWGGKEFRVCMEGGGLNSLGRGTDRGHISEQLLRLRQLFSSEFIRDQYDPSKKVDIQVTHHLPFLSQPSAICARMLGNSAQSSNFRDNIMVPRAESSSAENEDSNQPPDVMRG